MLKHVVPKGKQDCMLCGNSAIIDSCYPETMVHSVTTLTIRAKLMESCEKRDDQCDSEVMNCL